MSTSTKRQRPRYKQGQPLNSAARRACGFKAKLNKKIEDDYFKQCRKQFGVDVTSIPHDSVNFSLITPLQLETRITTTWKPPSHYAFTMIPFATQGFGRLVEHYYNLFKPVFEQANCSIYQYYRVTLAQFQLRKDTFNDEVPSRYKETGPQLERPHDFTALYNFSAIAERINSFGKFEHADKSYCSGVPKCTDANPFFVTINNLNSVIAQLERNFPLYLPRKKFLLRTPFPVTQYDTKLWSLTNADQLRVKNIMDDYQAYSRFVNLYLQTQPCYLADIAISAEVDGSVGLNILPIASEGRDQFLATPELLENSLLCDFKTGKSQTCLFKIDETSSFNIQQCASEKTLSILEVSTDYLQGLVVMFPLRPFRLDAVVSHTSYTLGIT